MKQAIKILFFGFLINNISGQVKVRGNASFPPQQYESKYLDKTKLNIYYRYVFIPNLKEKKKTKSSLTVLQIGKNYFKFSDIFLLKRDSLDKQFSIKKNLGIKELNMIIPVISKTAFKRIVIKSLSVDSITVQGNVYATRYEFKDKAPKFNWSLKNRTKTILNYKVKKAIVNYGGRNWTAWYAEDIPINSGPYIFGNLPGLILELYDDKNNFHFLVAGMDNTEKEIYKRIESKILKTTKAAFFKAERNFHEKPELFIRAKVRGGAVLKKIPYNPIEFINK